MTPTACPARPRRVRAQRLLAAVLALGVLVGSGPGCACTLTGLVTGAFTGAIDAPAQVYRHHHAAMDRHPEYWVYNVLLFFPLGLAAGPLAGLAKGVALDIQFWILDKIGYEKAFTTYKDPSIWRPYTIHW